MLNNLGEYLKSIDAYAMGTKAQDINQAERVLVNTLIDVIRSEPYLPNKVKDLLIGNITSEQGMINEQLAINIGFNRENIHRNSLYQEGYPEGADIDVIYNNGWHAKNYVYGTLSNGIRIRSKKDFDTTDFIRNAVKLCAKMLDIDEKYFYINDIYNFYSPYHRRTGGIGNYVFE